MKGTPLRTGLAGLTACLATLCVVASVHAAEPAAPTTTTGVLNAYEAAIGNQPRTALQGRLKSELKKAQAEMDAAYAKVESGLKQIDSASTPEALHTLKHAQDSFKSFLHKECRRQGAALMGGSGAGDTDLACQVALTRWRTAQLLEK